MCCVLSPRNINIFVRVPGRRIGDRGDREILYVPNVYVPFPAPISDILIEGHNARYHVRAKPRFSVDPGLKDVSLFVVARLFIVLFLRFLEGSKGDTRKGDGEKHPENTLKTPCKHPENTLTLPFFLTFRVFFPILFVGIPFGPFQVSALCTRILCVWQVTIQAFSAGSPCLLPKKGRKIRERTEIRGSFFQGCRNSRFGKRSFCPLPKTRGFDENLRKF